MLKPIVELDAYMRLLDDLLLEQKKTGYSRMRIICAILGDILHYHRKEDYELALAIVENY